MATVTAEQILAALKKLGQPSKPGELADYLQVERPVLTRALKPLLASGDLKAIGKTAGRRIALPDQKFEEPGERTPPAAQTAEGAQEQEGPQAQGADRARGYAARPVH